MIDGAPLLQAAAVAKSFGRDDMAVHVLHGVSCAVHGGELVLLFGPSGSGKTTLVSIMAGLLRPTHGTVHICGSDVSRMTESEAALVRRQHLGFVFQSYNLFPALTALQNVEEVLAMKGHPRGRARELARSALERVGLGHRLTHRPGELSGGQKQRVAIARAIAGRPPIIIGDEVTAALDSESARAVMQALRDSIGPSTAALIVTHDRRLERYADRVLEMQDGRLTLSRCADRGVAWRTDH